MLHDVWRWYYCGWPVFRVGPGQSSSITCTETSTPQVLVSGTIASARITPFAFVFALKDASGEILVHHVPTTGADIRAIRRKYLDAGLDIGAAIRAEAVPFFIVSSDGVPTIFMTISSMPERRHWADIEQHAAIADMTTRLISALVVHVSLLVFQRIV